MTRDRAEIHDRRQYLAQGAYRVPISGLRCDTADEHQRFDKATRDLRNDAHSVEVYEIATLGRGLTGSRIATRSAPRARRALAPQGTGASRSPHGSPVRVGTGRARCHLATGRRAFGTDPCASLARGSGPPTRVRAPHGGDACIGRNGIAWGNSRHPPGAAPSCHVCNSPGARSRRTASACADPCRPRTGRRAQGCPGARSLR